MTNLNDTEEGTEIVGMKLELVLKFGEKTDMTCVSIEDLSMRW